jgi:hypothetical protein
VSTPNTIFIYDMRDSGVADMEFGDPAHRITPRAYFSTHPSKGAFIFTTFSNDINETFVRADIVFQADFFTNLGVDQAAAVFHEMLHAAFQANDPGLGSDLGMPHDDIDGWIDNGCPP